MTSTELAELYQKYGYLIHRRCQAILGDAIEAEDALQETFMRARKYDRGQQKDSVLGWLYGIAANVCFDLLHSRRRGEPVESKKLERLDSRSTGGGSDADQRAVVSMVLRQVDGAVRDIGVLHHLDGYTQDEVAAKTGYSRKTVGKKLALFEALFRELWSKATVVGSKA